MAAIDSLLKLVEAQKADALIVASERVPLLKKAGADLALSMPKVSHDMVVLFLEDLVDADQLAALRQGGSLRLAHAVGDQQFSAELRGEQGRFHLAFYLQRANQPAPARRGTGVPTPAARDLTEPRPRADRPPTLPPVTSRPPEPPRPAPPSATTGPDSLAVGPAGDEPGLTPGTTGMLYDGGVHPEARHARHGSRLLNAAVDTLRAAFDEVTAVTTWVLADAEPTRAFLQGAGFAPDGAWRDRVVDDDGRTAREVRLVAEL